MAVTDFGKKYAGSFQKRKEEGQLRRNERREVTVADDALKRKVAQSVESGARAKATFDRAQRQREFERNLGAFEAQRSYNLGRINSLMEQDRERRKKAQTEAAQQAIQQETAAEPAMPSFKRQNLTGNDRFAQAEATGEYNPYEDALAAMKQRMAEQAAERAREQAAARAQEQTVAWKPDDLPVLTADNQLLGGNFSLEDFNPPQMPNLAIEKQLKETEEAAAQRFDAGEWADANAKAGWTQIGGRIMQGINAAFEPAQALGADLGANIMGKVFGGSYATHADELAEQVKEKPAIGGLYDWAVDPMEKATAYADEINKEGGYLAKIGGSVIQNAVAQIPNMITALMSGGASTALDAFNRAQTTFGGAVLNEAKKMATNPNFLMSFGQMYGGRYEDAVDGGANPYVAALTSTITTLMNSIVEMGGGIENLPFSKATVGNWVKNALDEGKEEVIQQIIDQMGQKAMVDPSIPWYSTEDQNAVINPKVLGENALMGALAGGVIGGPGMIANNALNGNAQGRTERFDGAPQMNDIAMELARDENALKLDESGKYPRMNDQELARLAQEAADAEIAEEQALAVKPAQTGAQETTEAAQPAPVQKPARRETAAQPAQERRADIREAAQRIQDEAQKRQFVQTAEKYGEAALVFAGNYEGGDIAAYDRGFNTVYTAGRTGIPLATLRESADALTAGMSEMQKRQIWQAGRNEDVNTVTPGVKQLTTVKTTDVQKRQYKMLDVIGKKYGYQFDVVDSINAGMANGAYSGGRRIVVAADAADGAVVQTGVHELVHALKKNDADGFEVLKNVVVKHLEGSENWLGMDYAVNERMEQYRAAGQNLTEADALEEIICEAVPTFLTDEKAVRAFVNQNRTLAMKIRDFFVNFAKEIREIAERYMFNQDRDEIANLLGRSDALTEIALTFDRALEAAGEKEAAPGGETVFARNEGERNRALKVGEMINRFRSALTSSEWKRYYDELNKKHYDGGLFDDGQRTLMWLDGKLLLMQMQENGEFSVEGVSVRSEAWYNENLRDLMEGIEDGEYSVGRIEAWLQVAEAGDGPALFGSNDRYSYGTARTNGEKNSAGRGTAGVSGERDAYREGLRENAVRQTGSILSAEGEGSKFSLNKPVEQVGDLVAVHNVDPEGLARSLNLGGVPAPSIAVVKSSSGHSKFGTVSLVFHKDSIDPEADARNRVYGYDAWTPDKKNARIEYEVNEEVKKRIDAVLREYTAEIPALYRNGVMNFVSELDRKINNDYGFEGLIEDAAGNYGFMAAYLASAGDQVEMERTMRTEGGVSEEAIAKLEAVAAIFDHNDEYISKTPMSKIVEEYGDQIAEAMPSSFAWTKERYMRVLQRVSKYLRGELDARTVEVDDVEATNRKIDAAINEEDFEKWLRELFEGVQGRAGIAREVDPYDNRGNRKSFAQTHYEVTAENIVRALYENAERKGANFAGANAEGIAAVASKEYKSINAIRKDKGRLYVEDADAHDARYQKLDDELYAIMDDVRSVNPYADMDAAATAIMNAAQDGSRTATAIVRSFKKNGLTIDKGIGERIAAMYKEASEFPTGYFEAKPERVVSFDEVRAAIVPDSMDENIRKQLNAAVENVIVYPDGDETARLNALNGLEGVRFSLNNTAHARFDTATEAEKAAKAMRDSYINSDAFKKWFDGSVVTEPDGTPKIMYHGTSRSGFTLFDTYGSNYGLMGMGSYFTENTNIADSYTHKGKGNTPGVYAVYLKIDNPIDMDAVADNGMIDAWNEYFSDYLEDGEIRYGMTNEEALRVVEAAMQSEMIGKWEAIETIQDFYESQGYDGVTHIGGGRVNANGPKHRVYIAFDPTQIKSATANSGNFEPDHGDIRFSLNNTAPIESVMADDQNLMLPADVDVREESIKGVAASALSRGINERMNQQITGVANKILKETGSTYAKADIIANMKSLIDEYAENGATEDTLRAVAEMAKKIIESSRHADNTLRDQYADLRKKLRETGISLTETQKQEAANEAGSYNAYRQSLMGTVKLTNDGISLDAIWGEISSQNPEIFPPDTGEAEMVGRLTDFMMLMKPKYENPYGMDMDGAALEMAMRIQADLMGILGARDAAKAMYGTAEKFRKQYEAEFKVRLAEQKKERVEKFQKIAADLKAAKAAGNAKEQAAVMNRYRAAMKATALDEAYAEVRATYKAREEQKAENRKANELRGRVAKRAGELMKMFARPEKGKRIPTGLQGLVLDALGMLDINGEHAAAAGKETKKAAEFRDKLGGIRSFYEQVINSQSKGEAPEGMDGLMMAFTERNMAAMNEALDILGGGDKFRLRDMNSEQLKMLDELLKNIKHTVESVGKLWKIHRYQSVVELGNASIAEMDERGQQKIDADSAAGKGRDFFALDMLEPVSYGERLGEGGGEIIQGLLDGEKEKFSKIREAAEATKRMMKDSGITGYDIGKWRKNVHAITLGSGRVIRMSDVNIMELYLTANRQQGLQHLLANGMKIQSKESGQQPRHILITQADITNISGMLDAKQKKIADLMQGYLSGDVAKWGNDVTQRLYLYDAFGEQTYWPISSDPNSLKTQEPEADRAFTAITNAGFTKPLNVKATNPIIIGDAFDTFDRHIGEMASYAGYAEVMTDTLAWINYRQKSDDGLMAGSVKESIETLLGKGGIKYLTKLVQDINGARRGGDGMQIANALLRNYKANAVAGKIRVAIQQPMSIVRAAAEISPAYLLKGMKAGKDAIAEMQKHSALAWWKSNGNYDIGIGKSTDEIFWGDTKRSDTVMEKISTSGGLIDPGKMDDWAWARMWSAVKREISRTRPELKQGSDEYFKAVAERFEYIMDRTQVVDTVMHRSDMMRSKDGLIQTLTSFKAEPTKSYNMLMRAIMEVGRNPKSKAAKVKLARTTGAFAASAAATAAATALFDAFKNRDDDDDLWTYLTEGGFWTDWTKAFLNGFAGNINIAGSIPLVGEALEALQGEDVTLMQFESLTNSLNAVTTFRDHFFGENKKKTTVWGAVKPMLTAVSQATGMPVSGLIANSEMLARIYDPKLMQTKSEMASQDEAYKVMYEAIAKGDSKKAASVRAQLAKGLYGAAPKSPKEIDRGIAYALAENDERVMRAYRMREAGNQTQALLKLKKQIMADGFTDAQVTAAINRCESLLNTEETEKDMTAQLTAKMFDKNDLYAVIRGGSTADVAEVVEYLENVSTAQDPAKSIREDVAEEFRREYLELMRGGKTAQAEQLAKKMAVVGVDADDLAGWTKDDRYDSMKKAVEAGEADEARKYVDQLIEIGATTSGIVSSLNSRFKALYVEYMRSGKRAEANRLQDLLQGLGLYWKDGKTNYYRDKVFEDWLEDSE